MKLRPMLQVDDVEASSRWYRDVIGLRSGHGGPDYEMLYAGDDFVLQLHRLDAHEHGPLTPPTGRDSGHSLRGAGASLWFEASDRPTFETLVVQARTAGAHIAEEPHWNPLAHHHEASLVDLDGYVVVVHSPFEP